MMPTPPLFPSLLLAQRRRFLLWASSTNATAQQLERSAIQLLVIPPESESWVLALWDHWPCQPHRQGGLAPTQSSTDSDELFFSQQHHYASIALID